ncbi:hypothetical protein COU60_01850 [Candidatus Pacearchaeota archaeon CG10_big_fil_rev_8_21_14_0_10_34_76]|nr:MAG: hypothetical protein COU60_01850 [Candidatus Pacearchaeota archaeon CG10_big_fil_rev_8_21_14_0_10_34_76]
MLKKVSIFIISIILLTSFAFAQTDSTSSETDSEDIKSKTDNFVDKQIEFPQPLQILMEIILGVKGTISLSGLIIFIVSWILLLIFIASILEFTPFLKGGIKWLVAVLIMILFSISGGTNFIAKLFLGLTDLFNFLEGWSVGAMAFSIILLVIIFFILSKALKFLRNYRDGIEAEEEGRKIGTSMAVIKATGEWLNPRKK